MILASSTFIQFPGEAKWVIGFIALFHTAVGSLAIGFAFIVTVLQIVGYRRKDPKYDLLAKRVQLWHVCVYNIGTINAIGLVFALSGLYPQFWSQIFVQFYWTIIVEEFLFFLLATTVTFHYFFWDHLWGHKKMHIFLGSLLTPLFFLQFFIINGMSAFMLTPGFSKDVSQWSGSFNITGWDLAAFYNPSFLMLTLHRTLANFAYGAFMAGAVWGGALYLTKRKWMKPVLEKGGQIAFFVGFIALLGLPIFGYGYALALKYHAPEAYLNLMKGRGDIVAGGIDWWWLKHLVVPTMIGMGLAFYHKLARQEGGGMLTRSLIYGIGLFYLSFYVYWGAVMTWFFCVATIAAAVFGALLALHLVNRNEGSGRGVLLILGILSFATVCLGGYSREASRPRFTSPSGERQAGQNRISHIDNIYYPPERQVGLEFRNVVSKPDYVPDGVRTPSPNFVPTPADLVNEQCSGCHTFVRMKRYVRDSRPAKDDWARVVRRMKIYGARLSPAEVETVTDYLVAGGIRPAPPKGQDNE